MFRDALQDLALPATERDGNERVTGSLVGLRPVPMQRLGTLAHDRGQVRFHYDKIWLTQQDIAFAIDPQLTLDMTGKPGACHPL